MLGPVLGHAVERSVCETILVAFSLSPHDDVALCPLAPFARTNHSTLIHWALPV